MSPTSTHHSGIRSPNPTNASGSETGKGSAWRSPAPRPRRAAPRRTRSRVAAAPRPRRGAASRNVVLDVGDDGLSDVTDAAGAAMPAQARRRGHGMHRIVSPAIRPSPDGFADPKAKSIVNLVPLAPSCCHSSDTPSPGRLRHLPERARPCKRIGAKTPCPSSSCGGSFAKRDIPATGYTGRKPRVGQTSHTPGAGWPSSSMGASGTGVRAAIPRIPRQTASSGRRSSPPTKSATGARLRS